MVEAPDRQGETGSPPVDPAALRGDLADRLAAVGARALPAEASSLLAAVVLLLRPPPSPPDPPRSRAEAYASLELLFVRRAEADGDPWSGHVAFPGGRKEPEDGDLREAARRELREETGIRLADPDLVGRLDDVHPRSHRLPSIAITPWVGWSQPGAKVREGREITAHRWISLGELLDPGRRSVLRRRRGHVLRIFPTVEFEGETIWGLTLAILRGLLARLPLEAVEARSATP